MKQFVDTPPEPSAVLFDLDGTLVDTAPDMVEVLSDMRKSRGVEPVAFNVARAYVSNGAIGLLRLGFPDSLPGPFDRLHNEYLERYSNLLCVRSALFPELAQLLDELDRLERPWGVVTNKPKRLTEPLMQALGLMSRAASVVSGDTLPQKKPDPAPLLYAARQIGLDPSRCVYIGDAARDIQAGRAAGMYTIAVRYGYIVPDDDISTWGADRIVADPAELAQSLLKAGNLVD
ncbi:MAG: HAD-IA family hydrolase [Woeseiaceae bacterium]